MKTTVKTIADFYSKFPDCIGKLTVNTRNGFKNIEYADITAYDSNVIRTQTISGKTIETSPDHLLWSSNRESWVKVSDLTLKDSLSTKSKNGECCADKIKFIMPLDIVEDLYDLHVDGEEYLANDIVSHNSSILDGLCFCLFNKPFRDINKNQIINSINGKGALTTCIFSTMGKQYKVNRGIKPNIFEIYEDGILLNQTASNKDYQSILEKQILGLNYKTFTQVVILGSSSYTPFMKLNAASRRGIIENILDISIFSSMSSVLKLQVTDLKGTISETNTELALKKAQLTSQKKLIETIEAGRNASSSELKREKSELLQRLVDAEGTIKELKTDAAVRNELIAPLKTKLLKVDVVNSSITEVNTRLKMIQKNLNFFSDHEECSLCAQNILHDHKTAIVSELESDKSEAEKSLEELRKLSSELNKVYEEVTKRTLDLTEVRFKLDQAFQTKKYIEDDIDKIDRSLLNIKSTPDNLDSEKFKMKTLAGEIMSLLESKAEQTERKLLQEISTLLLKDSGFKAEIIREYLPLMNTLINEYLQVQGSYIQFEIDEEFNEKIKSRFRDEFTYQSFSEGERQRIDLAILFTWRQIAKLKNSAGTNLLILDEIMDGSLDEEGIESAMSLIEKSSSDGTCVFVVSHNQDTTLHDKFSRVLRFEKKHDFSTVSVL